MDALVETPPHHAKETFFWLTNALEFKIKLDFTDMNPPRAMAFGEATVTDVNRQRWTSSTHLLVHPATHYVGLRSLTSFVPRRIHRGGRWPPDRAAHCQNHCVGGSAPWTKKRQVEEVADKQTCTLVSASEPKTCRSRQMRAVATG